MARWRASCELCRACRRCGYRLDSGVPVPLSARNRTVPHASAATLLSFNLVQYGVAVIVILFNNSVYGTAPIRIHEENKLEGWSNETRLRNPAFHALTEAYGAHAERVATTAEFPPAFERAQDSGRSALTELIVDEEAIPAIADRPAEPSQGPQPASHRAGMISHDRVSCTEGWP